MGQDNGRRAPADRLTLAITMCLLGAQTASAQEKPSEAPITVIDAELPTVVVDPPKNSEPKDYGPAPAVKAPAFADPKARKQWRRDRRTDSGICMGTPSRLPEPNENALKACDRLLASTLDEDEPWDRRAELLQRRAALLIALKDYDQALTDLDAADAIGKAAADPLFDGGVGIGNGMLRAVALGRMEKRDAAYAELDRIAAIRPHATLIIGALDRIRFHFSKDIDAMLATNAGRVRWQPDAMRMLVPLYIWRGDLAAASKFADDVSLIDPKPQSGWNMSGSGVLGAELKQRIELDMQRAYIWAGLGQGERGSALIAEARAEIAEFVGSEPIAQKGEKISKSKLRDYEARKAKGAQFGELVTRWQKAIALRADALVKPAEELSERDSTALGVGTVAGIDIMRKLRFNGAEEGAAVSKLVADLDKAIADDLFKIENADLVRMLPEGEQLKEVPNFGWGGSQLLFGNGRGYSQAREKGSDISTVRFGTFSGTGPTAEELALLAAAQYTEKEGKDSFILLARRALKRSQTISYGYSSFGTTYDAGYESQLRLVMLDSANIPPEWQAKKARLITVKEVREALAPRYDAIEARKAAAKAARN